MSDSVTAAHQSGAKSHTHIVSWLAPGVRFSFCPSNKQNADEFTCWYEGCLSAPRYNGPAVGEAEEAAQTGMSQS